MKIALAAVCEKYGCDVSIGNISYNETEINVTTKFVNVLEGISAEQTLFNEYCRGYGFTKQDYNKNFQFEGKTMRFYGFNPKARKYHCLAQNIRTKENYAISLDVVRLALKQV